MATVPPAVTLQPANGRIQPLPNSFNPASESESGLILSLVTPASALNADVRPCPWSSVTLESKGQILSACDKQGNVYSFHLKANRYIKHGSLNQEPSTAGCSSVGGQRHLYIAAKDGSLHAFDVDKDTLLGVLKAHRTGVSHICVRQRTGEILTCSVDSIILWDGKKLQRKRSLGGGPHGAIQAAFTADEEHIVAGFQDASFYVWHANEGCLVRSWRTPGPPSLRQDVTCFALSPDGQLLAAGGLRLPMILVFNMLSGTLLHAVLLPHSTTTRGTTQLAFLPGADAQLVCMCSDGSIAVLGVQGGTLVAQIPYTYPNRRDSCSFTLDKLGKRLAMIADGVIMLYDLQHILQRSPPATLLTLIPPDNLESAYTQMRVQPLSPDDPLSHELLHHDPRHPIRHASPSAMDRRSKGGVRGDQGAARVSSDLTDAPLAAGRKAASRAAAAGRAVSKLGPTGELIMERGKLVSLLERFGEYPSKYRLMIWNFLLQLPRNMLAFQVLVNRGSHPSFKDLPQRYPLMNKAITARLGNTLSQLANWCPVFGEISFLPALVFPFVKLHVGAGSATSTEACFEMLATLLTNWTQGWFELFPEPPLRVLAALDALLTFHDAPLAAHLRGACSGGVASLSWALMQDLMSSVLPRADWLKLWDHCISVGPDYLHYFITCYFMHFRSTLLDLDTSAKLNAYLSKPLDCNMNKVLRAAYSLRVSTPAELRPCLGTWEPLPASGPYTPFTQYPPAAVELFSQERKRIAEAEEALLRRRRVVAELATRTTALGLQANSLVAERQQLAVLQQQRRDQMRQLEASMLAEAQKLDDKAKEERLKQVMSVERAHQSLLVSMRQEWQSELSSLRQEVTERRQMMMAQIQSRAESESISQLEFAARQRLSQLQQEAAQQAVISRMKDEAHIHTAELEALQKSKEAEWRAEEEQRAVAAQHELERQRRVALAAEDAAAQAAVRREIVAAKLALQQQVAQVEAERQLRKVAEQHVALTESAVEQESQRVAAAGHATTQAATLQAQMDASWLAAEQQRRQQLLSEQHQVLLAGEAAARQQVEATQAQVRQLADQAALLQQRMALETFNAEEELQARQVMAALAAERIRASQLTEELKARELQVAAALAQARGLNASGPSSSSASRGPLAGNQSTQPAAPPTASVRPPAPPPGDGPGRAGSATPEPQGSAADVSNLLTTLTQLPLNQPAPAARAQQVAPGAAGPSRPAGLPAPAAVTSTLTDSPGHSLVSSGLAASSGQAYGRQGGVVVAARPSATTSYTATTQHTTSSSAASSGSSSPDVQSRLQTLPSSTAPRHQSRQAGLPSGLEQPVARVLDSPGIAVEGVSDQMRQLLLSRPLGYAQPPSSTGEVSDLDVFLDRIRRDLDLTDSDEEQEVERMESRASAWQRSTLQADTTRTRAAAAGTSQLTTTMLADVARGAGAGGEAGARQDAGLRRRVLSLSSISSGGLPLQHSASTSSSGASVLGAQLDMSGLLAAGSSAGGDSGQPVRSMEAVLASAVSSGAGGSQLPPGIGVQVQLAQGVGRALPSEVTNPQPPPKQS